MKTKQYTRTERLAYISAIILFALLAGVLFMKIVGA